MLGESIREQILSAAQGLFQKKGLGDVTMEDIANAAGKGKSTLYYYYKSKEEIFTAVLEKEIDEVILETIRQTGEKEGLSGKLFSFAMLKYRMAGRRRSLFKLVDAGLDAEEWMKFRNLKREVHRYYYQKEKVILSGFFIEAMNRTEIRHVNDAEMEAYILIFLSSIRGLNREFFFQQISDDAANLISSYCGLFVKGMK